MGIPLLHYLITFTFPLDVLLLPYFKLFHTLYLIPFSAFKGFRYCALLGYYCFFILLFHILFKVTLFFKSVFFLLIKLYFLFLLLFYLLCFLSLLPFISYVLFVFIKFFYIFLKYFICFFCLFLL